MTSPGSQPVQQQYVDGAYLRTTAGTWHREHSSYKASQVARMLARHPEIAPQSICDIGAGAGGVLHELSRQMPAVQRLVGYEISPQAHQLSLEFATDRCRFTMEDAFADPARFDLALILDVAEHVEDCFHFLRQCATKATWKIYILPLDTSASMVLRGVHCWDSVGHLHQFTMETARKLVEHCNQTVVDWFLTPTALKAPHRVATRVTNIGRRLLPERFAARLLGGYSILILAK